MTTPAHAPSLGRRLFVPLFWGWAVGIAAVLVGATQLARSSAERAFDRSLQDEASALAAKVVWTDRGPLLDLSRQAMELLTWDSSDRNAFVMVDLDGNALAGDGAVPVPADHHDALGAPRLFDAQYQGEPVRGAVFAQRSPMLDRTVSIVVVETKRRRVDVVRELQLGIVLPTLALGIVTFGLIGWSVRRAVRPLREVGSAVALRDVNDWRPMSLAGVPAEAVPLIERLNQLLLEVQQSIALQRRFVADAAHQLRTPVAGIRVLAQELERELAAGGEGWRPLLGELRGTSERLSRLISQLLSLARSETALTMNAEHHPQDIVPLLREATEPLVLQGLRAGRSIELDAPEAPVVARAHPIWLGEVVNNLLDNAQRYGGPHIVLRVRALETGGAEVVVEDDGPGVPPEHMPRLFEPFWRGERADVRNDGGTGLGLAIAREIVERLGGSIVAAGRPAVPGMRFTVTLAA